MLLLVWWPDDQLGPALDQLLSQPDIGCYNLVHKCQNIYIDGLKATKILIFFIHYNNFSNCLTILTYHVPNVRNYQPNQTCQSPMLGFALMMISLCVCECKCYQISIYHHTSQQNITNAQSSMYLNYLELQNKL